MTRSHRARPSPPGRPARRARRWRMRLAGAVSCGVLVTSGLGWSVVDHVNTGIDRVDAFSSINDRPKDDDGLNFLVVGVDKRDGLTARDRHRMHAGGAACDCTDTIMLLHVSRDRRRASVVSIPRDSYVEFPARSGHGAGAGASAAADARSADSGRPAARRHGKINAAYAIGGPSLTVSTVEKATGVRIDHYVEIDFRSFVRTVDALGGVEVCSMAPLHDAHSGLDLPRGTSTLDGAGALRYVRARHIGGRADFGRIERQQHFLAQIIRQLRSGGVLTNPAKLTRVVDTVLASIRADKDLSSADVVTLGTAMRHLTPSGSEFTQVPVAEADYRGDPRWGSAVLWDRAKAARLFEKIREDRPLTSRRREPKGRKVPIDPRSIRVQVYNATGTPGLGARADAALAETGFATTGKPADGTRTGARRTVVSYDPRWDRSAKSLAAALPGARLVAAEGQGPVMKVTVGSGFSGVTRVRAEKSGLTENPDGAVTGDEVLCV